jgi:hypothetical protein
MPVCAGRKAGLIIKEKNNKKIKLKILQGLQLFKILIQYCLRDSN